ncbi:MAG TPA: VOC family protein [Gaiellaceae bacterium]|nr:VOC family protein [Gaiellaceae bacterium]
MMLSQTIPALPVRDAPAAVDFYCGRLGFDVLHPAARDGVADPEYGAREVATIDLDGNLIVFFEWDDAS